MIMISKYNTLHTYYKKVRCWPYSQHVCFWCTDKHGYPNKMNNNVVFMLKNYKREVSDNNDDDIQPIEEVSSDDDEAFIGAYLGMFNNILQSI